jgi:lipopolysaccharide transport system ATP-binding protein
MSKVVLKAENISKQYRLGQLGTGTISHDLNRAWAKLRGKEDPYLKVGDTNDRAVAGGSDYVWSLKDINFEVKQGDVLGIIGKNGAGKSTLLKILSQVTTPTTGQVAVRGRIAALLEVGTGFHPDLSGRENIFLNGAILGMTKAEIKSKLDEIVDFSGVAKYLDTPVKRYSSGMMVRLGFAVAAHLEPEILIVDEVLAVGDAEFQKKCLGKMKDVSGQGRTVLFVSHNMGAIKGLCNKSMLLKKGCISHSGDTSEVVNRYLGEAFGLLGRVSWEDEVSKAPGSEFIRLTKIELRNNGQVTNYPDIRTEIILDVYYKNFKQDSTYQISIHLMDINDNMIIASLNAPSACLIEDVYYDKPYDIGIYKTEVRIPANLLNEGGYYFNLIISKDRFISNHIYLDRILSFTAHDRGSVKKDFNGTLGGIIRPRLSWNTQKIKD